MTQIMVEVLPSTISDLHNMLQMHPKLSIAQLAGQMLDVQVRYRLEVDDRMRQSVEDTSPFGAGF